MSSHLNHGNNAWPTFSSNTTEDAPRTSVSTEASASSGSWSASVYDAVTPVSAPLPVRSSLENIGFMSPVSHSNRNSNNIVPTPPRISTESPVSAVARAVSWTTPNAAPATKVASARATSNDTLSFGEDSEKHMRLSKEEEEDREFINRVLQKKNMKKRRRCCTKRCGLWSLFASLFGVFVVAGLATGLFFLYFS